MVLAVMAFASKFIDRSGPPWSAWWTTRYAWPTSRPRRDPSHLLGRFIPGSLKETS